MGDREGPGSEATGIALCREQLLGTGEETLGAIANTVSSSPEKR